MSDPTPGAFVLIFSPGFPPNLKPTTFLQFVPDDYARTLAKHVAEDVAMDPLVIPPPPPAVAQMLREAMKAERGDGRTLEDVAFWPLSERQPVEIPPRQHPFKVGDRLKFAPNFAGDRGAERFVVREAGFDENGPIVRLEGFKMPYTPGVFELADEPRVHPFKLGDIARPAFGPVKPARMVREATFDASGKPVLNFYGQSDFAALASSFVKLRPEFKFAKGDRIRYLGGTVVNGLHRIRQGEVADVTEAFFVPAPDGSPLENVRLKGGMVVAATMIELADIDTAPETADEGGESVTPAERMDRVRYRKAFEAEYTEGEFWKFPREEGMDLDCVLKGHSSVRQIRRLSIGEPDLA